MPTGRIAEQYEFEAFDGRRVAAAFDGGSIGTDAGALLLHHADRAIGLFERVASCFIDQRTPELVVHELPTLVGQRVCGIALGHEDLDDHDHLRHDPVPTLLWDRLAAKREDCAALAGRSALNRLEHAPSGAPGRPRSQHCAVNGRFHSTSAEGNRLDTLTRTRFGESGPTLPMSLVAMGRGMAESDGPSGPREHRPGCFQASKLLVERHFGSIPASPASLEAENQNHARTGGLRTPADTNRHHQPPCTGKGFGAAYIEHLRYFRHHAAAF